MRKAKTGDLSMGAIGPVLFMVLILFLGGFLVVSLVDNAVNPEIVINDSGVVDIEIKRNHMVIYHRNGEFYKIELYDPILVFIPILCGENYFDFSHNSTVVVRYIQYKFWWEDVKDVWQIESIIKY